MQKIRSIGLILLLSLLTLVPLSSEAASLTSTTCPGSGCTDLNVGNAGSIAIQVTGTWVGTITFQSSVDNSTYTSLLIYPSNSATGVTTTTGNGVWTAPIAGFSIVRVKMTAYTSGTAVVTIKTASQARNSPGGSGGGSGTVTSVGLTMPTAVFDVAGSPVTDAGDFTVTFDTQTANKVFASAVSGGAAVPAFRALVTADLPAATGTVTSIATSSPITGGTITTTGTIACSTCGVTGSPLSQFASTTSAQFLGVISNETGSGLVVGNDTPTFVTPVLGVASATKLGIGIVTPELVSVLQVKESGAATPTNSNTYYNGIDFMITAASCNAAQFGIVNPTTTTDTNDGYQIGVCNDGALYSTIGVGTNSIIGTSAFALESRLKLPLSTVYGAGQQYVSRITSLGNIGIASAYFFDAYINSDFNADELSGHDFTTYLNVASGKTIGSLQEHLFDPVISGPGSITTVKVIQSSTTIDETQVGAFGVIDFDIPVLSSGATLGSYYYVKLADVSGITTSGAKGAINYGAGKFVVDSAGGVTSTSSVTARYVANGSTPAVTDTSANSCGTGTQTIVGNDNAGKVTVIGSVGTSCTVTFATAFTNAPSCTVTNETTAALVRATSTTGTTILAGTFAQNDVLAYICMGR